MSNIDDCYSHNLTHKRATRRLIEQNPLYSASVSRLQAKSFACGTGNTLYRLITCTGISATFDIVVPKLEFVCG